MSAPIYFLKRVLQAIPLLIIISIMSFSLLKVAKIDPLATLRANPSISRAAIQAEERRLGLDKPAPVQYCIWLGNLLHGDLGVSTEGGGVSVLLLQRAGNTLLLGVCTIVCTWTIAVPAGIFAAVHRGQKIDRIFGLITAVGMAMPGFFMALLLLMFALATGLLPLGGLTSPDFFAFDLPHQIFDVWHHLIIPVTVLTFIGVAGIQRQMRGNLLEVLRAEYVRTARAKGLPENRVIYAHALRNAVNPLITLLGFEFASLLSGAALTETVLAYPGLGRLTLEAVLKNDLNLVMASLMLGSTMLILGNLLADILLKFVDPRIALEG